MFYIGDIFLKNWCRSSHSATGYHRNTQLV